jgi:hypothetical protein
MNRSSKRNNNGAARVTWLRRVHRWTGLAALVFVLLLATTGIALNHTAAWRLDETWVDWAWLLHAYGIDAPRPSASFTEDGTRATLLGGRLYVDGREIARNIETLAGLAVTGERVVVAAGKEVFLLTESGDLIERMDLDSALSAAITEVGLAQGHVVLRTDAGLFRFDDDLLNLEPAPDLRQEDVQWSPASAVPPDESARLRNLYRGRGITVERLLVDLHSGRIVPRLGALLMDLVAILLIALGISGLIMWMRRR